MEKLSLLKRAANSNIDRNGLPNSAEVTATLLYLEKAAKKEKNNYTFSNLIGCWNLRFITGTKKSRAKAGIVLGEGRYIPQWIKIKLIYEENSQSNVGRVKNSVDFAGLNLTLIGPVKFICKNNNLLVFDFTQMSVKLLGLKIYDGYLKNGKLKEKEFYETEIKKQAFFNYFLIEDSVIAARGRGGGLALWGKSC